MLSRVSRSPSPPALSGGDAGATWTYNWSVPPEPSRSGQGTSTITVDTNWSRWSERNRNRQHWRRGSELHRHDASCTTQCEAAASRLASLTSMATSASTMRRPDSTTTLSSSRTSPDRTGTIIVYGSCAGEAQQRGDRAKDYLVNTRGIEAGRITVVDGGCRSDLTVQLWIVPQGAAAPTVDTTGAISPCPECKRGRAPRRRRGDEE